jgi:hypothetical protein
MYTQAADEVMESGIRTGPAGTKAGPERSAIDQPLQRRHNNHRSKCEKGERNPAPFICLRTDPIDQLVSISAADYKACLLPEICKAVQDWLLLQVARSSPADPLGAHH